MKWFNRSFGSEKCDKIIKFGEVRIGKKAFKANATKRLRGRRVKSKKRELSLIEQRLWGA